MTALQELAVGTDGHFDHRRAGELAPARDVSESSWCRPARSCAASYPSKRRRPIPGCPPRSTMLLRLAAHAQLDAVVIGRHAEIRTLLEQQRQLGGLVGGGRPPRNTGSSSTGTCVAMTSSSPGSRPSAAPRRPSPSGMPARSTGISEERGMRRARASGYCPTPSGCAATGSALSGCSRRSAPGR